MEEVDLITSSQMEEVLAVNVSQAELAGGKKKKINRLNKAKRWTGFSTDTAREGIGLTDEAWTVYGKHDAKKQAIKKVQICFKT